MLFNYCVNPVTYCSKCKGECWDPKSNKKTQENAKAMFGVIPNNCVNGSSEIYCPYHNSSKK